MGLLQEMIDKKQWELNALQDMQKMKLEFKMIKEDKYYTPDIEEFHIGFEFEYLDINTKEWTIEIDFTTFYDYDTDSTWNLKKYIDDFKIRVKYLDKEDIESLGFKYNETSGFHENNIIGVALYYDHQIRIWHQGSDFLGTFYIKNKSELIKLLDQVNVKGSWI